MTEKLFIPSLARGAAPLKPPRSLRPEGQGPLWTKLHNLVPRDGLLKRREGLEAWVDLKGDGAPNPTYDYNTNEYNHLPVLIYQGRGLTLVVTTRELFTKGDNSSAWANETPTHTQGTVTVTNGSSTVTGVGTNWKARGIVPTQLFQGPDNAWYRISSVTSDTVLAITPVYAGANAGPGAAYTIRRTFVSSWVAGSTSRQPLRDHLMLNPPILRFLQGDGYLAGMLGSGWSGSAPVSDGSIIKLTGLPTFNGTSATYIFAGLDDPTITTTLDPIGERIVVVGFEFLDDGRAVLGTWEASSIQNRIWMSSPTDLTQWTTTPGGFLDVEGAGGVMTGLRRFDRDIAVHMEDEIFLGTKSGRLNSPLNLTETRTKNVGALSHAHVVNIPGGQYAGQVFIGSDMQTYVFNGDTASPIDMGWSEYLRSKSHRDLIHNSFMVVDNFREDIRLIHRIFDAEDGAFYEADEQRESKELRFNYRTGEQSEAQYPVEIGCFSLMPARQVPMGPTGPPHDLWSYGAKRGELVSLVGVRSMEDDGSTDNFEFVLQLNEDADDDTVPGLIATPELGGIYAETDDWDMGDPFVRKVITRAVLWLRSPHGNTSTANVTISRSFDSGATWDDTTVALAAQTDEQALTFFYDEESGEKVRFRFSVGTGLSLTVSQFRYALSQMMVFFAKVGDERAA